MISSTEPLSLPDLNTVALQRDGHVLLIGLNRPHKRNAFDRAMLADLSRAYGVLESDPSVRAGVLYAQGDHFTAGTATPGCHRTVRQPGCRRGCAVVHRTPTGPLPRPLDRCA
jgi:enoyl-CoA hydratase/carnithine racemase